MLKIFVLITLFISVQGSLKVNLIAHMANTQNAVNWAVKHGANMVESDLQFENNEPSLFEHRGLCDCVCKGKNETNICSQLNYECEGEYARENVKEHLRNIARHDEIEIFIMDAKIGLKSQKNLEVFASSVGNTIQENLFNYGFKGKVAISCSSIIFSYCLKLLSLAPDRYLIVMDRGTPYFLAQLLLAKLKPSQKAFGVGLTSCIEFPDLRLLLKRAAADLKAKKISLLYIWTVDNPSIVFRHFDYVNGVMTNAVGEMRNLIDFYEKNDKKFELLESTSTGQLY